MTHTEARISNELADRLERIAAAADDSSAGAKAVMLEAAQALHAPAEAKPISWLSFNDNSEPYLTGNQAEMIKLEAAGPGPHALYARPRPSPSDGEVSEADIEAAAKNIYDEGPSIGGDCECGWAEQTAQYKQKARMVARAALQSSKRGQP